MTFRACRQRGHVRDRRTVKGTRLGGRRSCSPTPTGARDRLRRRCLGTGTGDAWRSTSTTSRSPTVRQPDTVDHAAAADARRSRSPRASRTRRSSARSTAASSRECKNPTGVRRPRAGRRTRWPCSRSTSTAPPTTATRRRSTFTIDAARPPPPPPPADRDRDGVPDATRQLPRRRQLRPGRRRRRRRRRRLRRAPAGQRAAEAGGDQRRARSLSGEVFVKLPARTALGFDGLRAPLQASGFVPLKGVASIPIGSTVDTTRGEVAIDSAANSFSAADRRAKRQSGPRSGRDLPAQAEAREGQERVDPDRREPAVSPPGAEARCVGAPAEGHGGPLDLDGRQGLLPHDRRREHEHRPLRDVQHRGPL